MIATLIAGALLLAAVVFAVRKIIRDRKNGRGSCGGDCSRCKGCR